ncbi:FAD-binding protein [Dermatophilaceae bacterium Soc4.6]
MSPCTSHRVVVIGGGNAGIAATAQLQRAGVEDIAVIEPSNTHHHQPLWTVVDGGCAPAAVARRPRPT